MTTRRIRALLSTVLGTGLVLGMAACGPGGTENGAPVTEGGLPETMVWTTYPVGTTTYNDLAAVAEMVTSDMGKQVRITPSDTAIGRMTPLLEGQAHFSRTGDEYIFSFEADHDFAQESQGPHPTRVVYPVEARQGFTVLENSGIESYDDLRGKRFPNVTANPSINQKIEALLAYAGLERDDVEFVDVSYGDQPGALENGQVDVIFFGLYGSPLFELEQSRGVRVLSMDDESPEALDRLRSVSKVLNIGDFQNGPGMEEGETIRTLMYPLPVVALESTSPEAVEELVTGFAENFESYKDSTPTTPDWALEEIPKVPTVVPYHDGLISYLESQGEWSEEAQQANDELLERETQLDELWDTYLEQADEVNHETWNSYKESELS
ncbi:hypothetical protein GCM10022261_08800 [Brevibacterium daeguense]|uniref:TAXI family TRAP transporter solute-binding subunit n=1 Tax=Brevibacterium daeguense TaxID=909936 RepID=A0ABP8EHA8_9MICO|nr:TAXI family TRAP transporter solute-binding subunit [Brevibacterium daeguense]